jgi:hypothetical protein
VDDIGVQRPCTVVTEHPEPLPTHGGNLITIGMHDSVAIS